ADFVAWVSKKEYDYTTRSEKLLEEFRNTAEKEKYLESIASDFEAMKKNMMHDKELDLQKEKKQVMELLEGEIIARYYFQSRRIQASFRKDPDITKASELLNDREKINQILAKK